MKAKESADVLSLACQCSERDASINCRTGSVVQHIDSALRSWQPQWWRTVCFVQEASSYALDILVATLSRVLMLMMWLWLPAVNEQVVQDVVYFVADFNFARCRWWVWWELLSVWSFLAVCWWTAYQFSHQTHLWPQTLFQQMSEPWWIRHQWQAHLNRLCQWPRVLVGNARCRLDKDFWNTFSFGLWWGDNRIG